MIHAYAVLLKCIHQFLTIVISLVFQFFYKPLVYAFYRLFKGINIHILFCGKGNAWQTWRRIPPSDNVQDKKPTWLMGFFLQLINVKIIIYGLTMFSAYILPYEARVPILFCFAVYLMFLGALGNLIWAFAGNVLKRFYSSHYKLMNGIMALLLVWCSLRITGLL